MDSGNSGSIQSSSGGDEEFDSSKGESISSFFNPSLNFGAISSPNPQMLGRQNPNFFDDPMWSRPQFNFPNFGGGNPSQSSQQSPFPIPTPPSAPPRADSDGHGSISKSSDHHHQHLAAVTKNPKKRTRASRRAPTTVLTTDTTNFRQMVQEFTGIPSSPFAGTSPYSRRLDLFSAAAPAALRLGGHLDTLGPLYSLRPQFPPPSSSPPLNSTMIDSIIPSTTILNPNTTTIPAAAASTSNNAYHLPSDHLLTLQNPPIPLQLGGNPFGGFSSQGHGDDDGNADNDGRWKSGATVRNNGDGDDDGVEENVATTDAIDGSRNSNSSHHHHHHHQHHQQISGHNHNLNLAEKAMGNAGSSSSVTQGTVAPWIYPSQ